MTAVIGHTPGPPKQQMSVLPICMLFVANPSLVLGAGMLVCRS